jgi:hypothetical protein
MVLVLKSRLFHGNGIDHRHIVGPLLVGVLRAVCDKFATASKQKFGKWCTLPAIFSYSLL